MFWPVSFYVRRAQNSTSASRCSSLPGLNLSIFLRGSNTTWVHTIYIYTYICIYSIYLRVCVHIHTQNFFYNPSVLQPNLSVLSVQARSWLSHPPGLCSSKTAPSSRSVGSPGGSASHPSGIEAVTDTDRTEWTSYLL